MNSISDLLCGTSAGAPGEAGQGNPLGTFVLGTVSQNDDKKEAGMVKVEYTAWDSGSNISAWMPVLQPYAGKDYGHYLVPEIGDVVLVGFIGRQLEKPFVAGSFFPAAASLPGAVFDAKNRHRVFKTKGGVECDIADEDGKQQASLTTPKGLRIELADEAETVKLTDKDGKNLLELDCKGGNVTVKADKKLTLECGSCSVTMESGGDMKLSCGTLKIEASQTGEVKAQNMLTLEGGTLKAEGKQQAALKGASMVEISGGMVKIN